MQKNKLIVTEKQAGFRLDLILSDVLTGLSRSTLQNAIEEGKVRVDGKKVRKSFKPKAGSLIEFEQIDTEPQEPLPEKIKLDIHYEDEDLLVINKERGMVVHPAAGHSSATLVNALLYHCGSDLSDINGQQRPGIVHRLDKDTGGLLVVAKTNFAHLALAKQLKDRSALRKYKAMAHGLVKQEQAVINAPIGRSQSNKLKFVTNPINSKSKEAITYLKLEKQFDKYALLSLRLETGRTHQIRVHLASIGHPIAGDLLYGPKNTPKELNGQCLHATCLGFVHPRQERAMRFESELPDYFLNFIEKVNK